MSSTMSRLGNLPPLQGQIQRAPKKEEPVKDEFPLERRAREAEALNKALRAQEIQEMQELEAMRNFQQMQYVEVLEELQRRGDHEGLREFQEWIAVQEAQAMHDLQMFEEMQCSQGAHAVEMEEMERIQHMQELHYHQQMQDFQRMQDGRGMSSHPQLRVMPPHELEPSSLSHPRFGAEPSSIKSTGTGLRRPKQKNQALLPMRKPEMPMHIPAEGAPFGQHMQPQRGPFGPMPLQPKPMGPMEKGPMPARMMPFEMGPVGPMGPMTHQVYPTSIHGPPPPFGPEVFDRRLNQLSPMAPLSSLEPAPKPVGGHLAPLAPLKKEPKKSKKTKKTGKKSKKSKEKETENSPASVPTEKPQVFPMRKPMSDAMREDLAIFCPSKSPPSLKEEKKVEIAPLKAKWEQLDPLLGNSPPQKPKLDTFKPLGPTSPLQGKAVAKPSDIPPLKPKWELSRPLSAIPTKQVETAPKPEVIKGGKTETPLPLKPKWETSRPLPPVKSTPENVVTPKKEDTPKTTVESTPSKKPLAPLSTATGLGKIEKKGLDKIEKKAEKKEANVMEKETIEYESSDDEADHDYFFSPDPGMLLRMEQPAMSASGSGKSSIPKSREVCNIEKEMQEVRNLERIPDQTSDKSDKPLSRRIFDDFNEDCISYASSEESMDHDGDVKALPEKKIPTSQIKPCEDSDVEQDMDDVHNLGRISDEKADRARIDRILNLDTASSDSSSQESIHLHADVKTAPKVEVDAPSELKIPTTEVKSYDDLDVEPEIQDVRNIDSTQEETADKARFGRIIGDLKDDSISYASSESKSEESIPADVAIEAAEEIVVQPTSKPSKEKDQIVQSLSKCIAEYSSHPKPSHLVDSTLDEIFEIMGPMPSKRKESLRSHAHRMEENRQKARMVESLRKCITELSTHPDPSALVNSTIQQIAEFGGKAVTTAEEHKEVEHLKNQIRRLETTQLKKQATEQPSSKPNSGLSVSRDFWTTLMKVKIDDSYDEKPRRSIMKKPSNNEGNSKTKEGDSVKIKIGRNQASPLKLGGENKHSQQSIRTSPQKNKGWDIIVDSDSDSSPEVDAKVDLPKKDPPKMDPPKSIGWNIIVQSDSDESEAEPEKALVKTVPAKEKEVAKDAEIKSIPPAQEIEKSDAKASSVQPPPQKSEDENAGITDIDLPKNKAWEVIIDDDSDDTEEEVVIASKLNGYFLEEDSVPQRSACKNYQQYAAIEAPALKPEATTEKLAKNIGNTYSFPALPGSDSSASILSSSETKESPEPETDATEEKKAAPTKIGVVQKITTVENVTHNIVDRDLSPSPPKRDRSPTLLSWRKVKEPAQPKTVFKAGKETAEAEQAAPSKVLEPSKVSLENVTKTVPERQAQVSLEKLTKSTILLTSQVEADVTNQKGQDRSTKETLCMDDVNQAITKQISDVLEKNALVANQEVQGRNVKEALCMDDINQAIGKHIREALEKNALVTNQEVQERIRKEELFMDDIKKTTAKHIREALEKNALVTNQEVQERIRKEELWMDDIKKTTAKHIREALEKNVLATNQEGQGRNEKEGKAPAAIASLQTTAKLIHTTMEKYFEMNLKNEERHDIRDRQNSQEIASIQTTVLELQRSIRKYYDLEMKNKGKGKDNTDPEIAHLIREIRSATAAMQTSLQAAFQTFLDHEVNNKKGCNKTDSDWSQQITAAAIRYFEKKLRNDEQPSGKCDANISQHTADIIHTTITKCFEFFMKKEENIADIIHTTITKCSEFHVKKEEIKTNVLEKKEKEKSDVLTKCCNLLEKKAEENSDMLTKCYDLLEKKLEENSDVPTASKHQSRRKRTPKYGARPTSSENTAKIQKSIEALQKKVSRLTEHIAAQTNSANTAAPKEQTVNSGVHMHFSDSTSKPSPSGTKGDYSPTITVAGDNYMVYNSCSTRGETCRSGQYVHETNGTGQLSSYQGPDSYLHHHACEPTPPINERLAHMKNWLKRGSSISSCHFPYGRYDESYAAPAYQSRYTYAGPRASPEVAAFIREANEKLIQCTTMQNVKEPCGCQPQTHPVLIRDEQDHVSPSTRALESTMTKYFDMKLKNQERKQQAADFHSCMQHGKQHFHQNAPFTESHQQTFVEVPETGRHLPRHAPQEKKEEVRQETMNQPSVHTHGNLLPIDSLGDAVNLLEKAIYSANYHLQSAAESEQIESIANVEKLSGLLMSAATTMGDVKMTRDVSEDEDDEVSSSSDGVSPWCVPPSRAHDNQGDTFSFNNNNMNNNARSSKEKSGSENTSVSETPCESEDDDKTDADTLAGEELPLDHEVGDIIVPEAVQDPTQPGSLIGNDDSISIEDITVTVKTDAENELNSNNNSCHPQEEAGQTDSGNGSSQTTDVQDLMEEAELSDVSLNWKSLDSSNNEASVNIEDIKLDIKADLQLEKFVGPLELKEQELKLVDEISPEKCADVVESSSTCAPVQPVAKKNCVSWLTPSKPEKPLDNDSKSFLDMLDQKQSPARPRTSRVRMKYLAPPEEITTDTNSNKKCDVENTLESKANKEKCDAAPLDKPKIVPVNVPLLLDEIKIAIEEPKVKKAVDYKENVNGGEMQGDLPTGNTGGPAWIKPALLPAKAYNFFVFSRRDNMNYSDTKGVLGLKTLFRKNSNKSAVKPVPVKRT